MVASCAIRGCKTYHVKNSGVKFYCVPFNEQRRRYWISECPFLRKYSDKELNNLRICSKHFHPHHISANKRLTVDALPILHLPNYDNPISEHFLEIEPLKLNSPLTVKVVTEKINEVYHYSDVPISVHSHSPQQPLLDIPPECTMETDQHIFDMPLPNQSVTELNSDPSSLLLCHETLLDDDSEISSQTSCLPQLNVSVDSAPLPFSESPSTCIQNENQVSESITTDPLLFTPHLPPMSPSAAQENNAHSESVFVISHRRSLKKTRKYCMSGPRIRLNQIENTPRKQKMRAYITALKSELRRCQLRYHNLKKKSDKNARIGQYLKKHSLLTNFGKLLVDSQLRLSGITPKGRRYTTEEKIFALSLYKLSPKAYSFLRKYIALPSKSNLNSILSQIPLRPGINDFIFQHLADASCNKAVIDKQCVLLFDEMAINKNLYFNFHTGVIEGFEDLGSGNRSSNVADKALVFMLRGLASPWKIPIAFYFVRDGIKTLNLKNIIIEIIKAVFKAGFHVRATISDQGSANVAAIKSLISESHAQLLRSDSNATQILYYTVENNKIYHIFDVPHLLKCFRNNFQKKDLLIGSQRAKWSHIEALYRADGHRGLAWSTKLTDKHINPQSYDKMKVKLAAQVFSREVATTLRSRLIGQQGVLADHNYSCENYDIESGLFTAEIIMFVNNLFDSLNGVGFRKGGLKCALSANSKHLEFWNSALKKLQSMKFDAPNERESIPLSLKNFIHDIKTIKHLWVDLQAVGFKFLSLKRVNQDPLENFFSQIRGQGGFCTNPDCHQFIACYKTLLLNNISTGKSLYANCSVDKDKMLGTIHNLVHQNQFSMHTDDFSHQTAELDMVQIPNENIFQTCAVSYIAGAICRYLLPKLNCAQCNFCKDALLSDSVSQFHNLIENREYDSDHKHLFYPSQNLMKLVWSCIYIIETLLPKMCSIYIYKTIIQTFENLDTNWITCNKHKVQFLNAFWLFVIRMQVKQWCIKFNRRIHNIDSRLKSTEMEDLIASKVTKGASYRSLRRKSN